MINKVSIKDKKGKEHVMSVDTYTRWLCLLEAMHHISKKGHDLKINLNTSSDWINPIRINKYIEERFHSLKHDIVCEEYLE